MRGIDEVADMLRKWFSRLRRSVGRRIPVGEVNSDNRKKAAKLAERGRQEYNAGLYDLAAELFEKALQLDPRYQKALYSLGNTYYKQRRGQEALAKWRACIGVDPQSVIASKARRRVQHLAKSDAQLEEQLRQLEEDLS